MYGKKDIKVPTDKWEESHGFSFHNLYHIRDVTEGQEFQASIDKSVFLDFVDQRCQCMFFDGNLGRFTAYGGGRTGGLCKVCDAHSMSALSGMGWDEVE